MQRSLLDGPHYALFMEKLEGRIACVTNTMKRTTAKTSQTSEEFDRFKEFTQKLMQVPKKEIDRQKAVYEKKKLSRNGSKRKAA